MRVDPQGLSDLLLERCDAPGLEVAEMVHEYGKDVMETRRELCYERIYSYNYRVGKFLLNFFEKEPERYLHLAQRDWRDRAVLKVRSFDGRSLTDPVLRQARGSILMNGFLSPPAIYRDLVLYDGEVAYLR